MTDVTYPELSHFLIVYLNEDFDIYGDSMEEIVGAYLRESDAGMRINLIGEIDRIKKDHPGDLEVAIEDACRGCFDPALWGYTATSFLDELKQSLQK
ncbi:contact-dependent growth inhibition system immunity protein [Cupriavidus sp. 2KB_3]|uniref:contact-dependent growth inhibition system immunity protein n=1 Tax=Cupriavidus TaxID=106589 RepID=UPI0016568D0F|nr:contact-dependent growth inhibition system immunity protein [Cupriavidus campinensis]